MRPEALDALEGCTLILHAGDVGSPDGVGWVLPLVVVGGGRSVPTTLRFCRIAFTEVPLMPGTRPMSASERASSWARSLPPRPPPP